MINHFDIDRSVRTSSTPLARAKRIEQPDLQLMFIEPTTLSRIYTPIPEGLGLEWRICHRYTLERPLHSPTSASTVRCKRSP